MKEDVFQRALRFLYERCLEQEGLRANVLVIPGDEEIETEEKSE